MPLLKLTRKILLLIIGLPVSIFLVISIYVPVYDFDEPTPFNGSCLYNPYEGIDFDSFYRCNFHCHSRRFCGLTAGNNNSDRSIDSVYRSFHFDHIGISDYQHINTYGKGKNTYLPAYEHGYGIFKNHQMCLNAKKITWFDYPLWQSLSMKQFLLNYLAESCQEVSPNHPALSAKNDYRLNCFKYLSNYRLMEVINGFKVSEAYWDMALSNGHRVYLIGGDDTHDVTYINDPANSYVHIYAQSDKGKELLDALAQGHAVGVTFPFDWTKTESFAHKHQRFEANMVRITSVQLRGDTLSVRASRPISNALFIGQGGKVLQTDTHTDETSYIIRPEDNYVRTILVFSDGTKLWLNPITRHKNLKELDHPRLDHFNLLKTACLWLCNTLFIAAITGLFIFFRKSSVSR